MKKKYFTYILVVVFSLFMFDNRVEAVEKNLGRTKTCDKVNVTYISSTSNYSLNCLYKRNEGGRCVILQLSFDKNGSLAKTSTNVENWEQLKEGALNYKFTTNFKYLTDKRLKELTSEKAKITSCPNVYVAIKTTTSVSDLRYTTYQYRFNFKKDGIFYTYNKMSKVSMGDEKTVDDKIVSENDEYKNMSCEEKLGGKDGDLIPIFQSIVNIIKIFVPILLIVFGILDFGKAIFSFDENEMKKAQTKFIKRIIVAVAFFLIPTFLGVILDIAHGIWPVIDDSFCGIEF